MKLETLIKRRDDAYIAANNAAKSIALLEDHRAIVPSHRVQLCIDIMRKEQDMANGAVKRYQKRIDGMMSRPVQVALLETEVSR